MDYLIGFIFLVFVSTLFIVASFVFTVVTFFSILSSKKDLKHIGQTLKESFKKKE